MERAFAAIGAKDLDGLAAYWHDDVIEDFVVLGRVEGKEAAREFFAEMFAALSDMSFVGERILEVDDTTAVGQWTISGVFDGGPFQGIEPTGRKLLLRGIDVMEFEDGLLRYNTVYYDGLKFARQIGLLPAEGSTPDRMLVTSFNALTKAKEAVLRR